MKTNNFANEGLRGLKTTNFLVGFILALGALFVALEFTQRVVYVIDEKIILVLEEEEEEDMIPLTFNSKPMLAPPATAPATVDYINEIMNNIDVPFEDIESPEETNQILPIQEGTGILLGTITAPEPEIDSDERFWNGGAGVTAMLSENDFIIPYDLHAWLKKNLKYPEVCREQGIQGRVVVRLCVEQDGSIVVVNILRSPAPELSKEVERVAMLMPKWEPARVGNKCVSAMVNLPVMFRLD